MTPDTPDWRSSPIATEVAGTIIENIDEICQGALAKHGTSSAPYDVLTATKAVFLEMYDQAKRLPGERTIQGGEERCVIEILVALLGQATHLLSDEAGASHFEVVVWMRERFEEALNNKIAEVKRQ